MPAYKCSIINLISTPELYDGKIVRVIGFYRKDFEHSAIYLSSIDAEHAISRNGVWVDYGSDEFGMSQYNNNYILLEGKFDIEMHGHLGAFPSAIKNIRRVAVWPPKENNPRELRAPAE